MSASSVGYGNSVGDNLFQIASQVDTIIECRVEGAILLLKLIDIWEFPEARIQYFRIFFFFLPSLFFFWKKVKPESNDHILLTMIHTYDCKER